MKLSFIILQYMAYEETIECVNSIYNSLKNKGEYNIIVVDNHSINDACKIIKDKFGNENNFYLIENEANIGYSKANNIGCEFAMKNFQPDFLYVINNDTIISQEDTIEIIENEYRESCFDVMGPDIETLTGERQNPIRTLITNRKGIIKSLILNSIMYFASFFYLDIVFRFIKKSFFIKTTQKQEYRLLEKEYDVGLHGSALIFSKTFYGNEIFYPEVSHFIEEDILNYRRIHQNFKFVFNPSLKILHKAHTTFNREVKAFRKRDAFMKKHVIRSLITFLFFTFEIKKLTRVP